MPTLLVIAYYFPPDGGGGTQRMAKFCRYLPEFGYKPIVLTRKPSDQRSFWDPEDPSLVGQIGKETQVIRVPTDEATPRDWARHRRRIDVGHHWLEPAFAEACRAIQTHQPRAILVTLGPYNLSHLARELRKRFDLPVILDLRDPWAFDGWCAHRTRGRWKRYYRQMVQALHDADGIIANTAQAKHAVENRIPGLEIKPITVIPNGYDQADFDALTQNHFSPGPEQSDQEQDPEYFHLVHTGTLHSHCLYHDTWIDRLKRFRYRPEPMDLTGRTAWHLLQAMGQLTQEPGEIGDLARRLRLVLVGQPDADTRRSVNESAVAQQVQITGYLPHDQSVARLRQAQALFLPLHGLKPGYRSLIVPGKTYEYLASGRPILGTLPQGDARDLVQSSGKGYLAPPCDAGSIAQSLCQLLTDWRDGKLASNDRAQWIERYERRALTADLVTFLDQLLAPNIR